MHAHGQVHWHPSGGAPGLVVTFTPSWKILNITFVFLLFARVIELNHCGKSHSHFPLSLSQR